MTSGYFDNCCYHRPYDDQDQFKVHIETEAKMYIQKMIVDKQLDLVYSFICEYENFQNPNTNNSRTIANFFKNAVTYVDISHKTEIRTEAIEIMKTGIKEMDTMQLASAIAGKVDYFLTVDKRLLKYQTDKIQIMNPTKFVSIMEV